MEKAIGVTDLARDDFVTRRSRRRRSAVAIVSSNDRKLNASNSRNDVDLRGSCLDFENV